VVPARTASVKVDHRFAHIHRVQLRTGALSAVLPRRAPPDWRVGVTPSRFSSRLRLTARSVASRLRGPRLGSCRNLLRRASLTMAVNTSSSSASGRAARHEAANHLVHVVGQYPGASLPCSMARYL